MLQIGFGSLRPLSLSAQLFHSGAYRREIVGSTELVHVCSSQ
jgi:hypothetical protein